MGWYRINSRFYSGNKRYLFQNNSSKINLWWATQNPIDDKSTLDQVMDWSRQAIIWANANPDLSHIVLTDSFSINYSHFVFPK